MIVCPARRHQMCAAMPFAEIFDDGRRFINDFSVILDNRRFAEWVDGEQLRGCKFVTESRWWWRIS